MTQERHYSDHPSYYVSRRPRIEQRLTAWQASMLPTPPGGSLQLQICARIQVTIQGNTVMPEAQTISLPKYTPLGIAINRGTLH